VIVQDGLFVIETGHVVTWDRLEVNGLYSAGDVVVSGERTFDQSTLWPVGASGNG
jgi:hypothetical protein